MRAPALLALSALLLVSAARGVAQETASPAKPEPPAAAEGGEAEVSPLWAWANFVILAGALGYLVAKKGGPFFAARSQSIRKGIAEAEQIRASAEASAAEVERRLAGLQAEIEGLRAHAHNE